MVGEIEQQSTSEPGVIEAAPAPDQAPEIGEAAAWDADALIAQAALAGDTDDTPEPDVDEEGDEDGSPSEPSDEDEEVEPDDDETDDDEDDEPDTGDPWAEGGQMRAYAVTVASTPQRINEVPGKLRGEVLQKVIASAYLRGQQDTQQQFASIEQQREFVATYDELRAEDPTAFFEWADEHPEDAARYWAARGQSTNERTPQPSRGGPEVPARTQPAQQETDPQIRQDVSREIDRIPAISDVAARNALIQRVQRGDFLMTPGGVSALREAIDAAEASGVTASPKSPTNPNSPAARRQEAAQKRRGLARAEEGGGRGSAGNPNPIASINDPDELIRMAVER